MPSFREMRNEIEDEIEVKDLQTAQKWRISSVAATVPSSPIGIVVECVRLDCFQSVSMKKRMDIRWRLDRGKSIVDKVGT